VLQAILFDLDGTLLDTAPDMIGALDALRAEHDLAPMNYHVARTQVSNGAAGLLALGFDHLGPDDREALRSRYLELYAARLAQGTRPFPGMVEVLDTLERAGIPWGVVTNKPGYLTEPLLAALALSGRCACVVSGDTLTRRKPDPAPLLHAAERLGVASSAVVYVGDAPRDIEAGREAGMVTVAVTYGYHAPGDDPAQWGADHTVNNPAELLRLPRLKITTTGSR
jgi:2-phosphoglycolate phosphatase